MKNTFDDLTKSMAQSVTRRGALKKFGAGLVGVALASLGLASRADARPTGSHCNCSKPPTYACEKWYPAGSQAYYDCVIGCRGACAKKGGPY